MDQIRVFAECPRCQEPHPARLQGPGYRSCVECKCRGLIELSLRLNKDGTTTLVVEVIGTWEVIHRMYENPVVYTQGVVG